MREKLDTALMWSMCLMFGSFAASNLDGVLFFLGLSGVIAVLKAFTTPKSFDD